MNTLTKLTKVLSVLSEAFQKIIRLQLIRILCVFTFLLFFYVYGNADGLRSPFKINKYL